LAENGDMLLNLDSIFYSFYPCVLGTEAAKLTRNTQHFPSLPFEIRILTIIWF